MTFVPHDVPYTDQYKVDGKPIDYLSWPSQNNPWVYQAPASPIVTVKRGNKMLTYDFSKWTKQETAAKP